MSRKIKVTKRHIKNGTPGSWDDCPIGLALIEAYNKEDFDDIRVEVGEDSICVELERDKEKAANGVTFETHERISFEINSPKKVCDFVEAFDDGQPVKPIEVTLPY